MQANWSLILNVLLLVGVVVAIGRMMKERRRNNAPVIPQRPSVGLSEKTVGLSEKEPSDDILSVRKINSEISTSPIVLGATKQSEIKPVIPKPESSLGEAKPQLSGNTRSPVMLFLLAKENRQLAGYELLQTLLAAGLRFGEGQLFHRHQGPNGQGPVLCSLAAATATGVFDLQNIGAFSVRGLCLFMQASGHPAIDSERFDIMLDTAKQLSDGLDTHLLDDQRKPLSNSSLKRYYDALNMKDECEHAELV